MLETLTKGFRNARNRLDDKYDIGEKPRQADRPEKLRRAGQGEYHEFQVNTVRQQHGSQCNPQDERAGFGAERRVQRVSGLD